MNILCVCRHGNVRSVATRQRLNRCGYRDVIAIGSTNTSPTTLAILGEWADTILCAEPQHARYLPRAKVADEFEIGEDIYGRYDHPILKKLIDQLLGDMELK